MNAPITVPSVTTLDNLCIAVAEKPGQFPGLVMLQYRLSTDNAKIGAISIQTNEELQLFKDCLRNVVVPPRLANGKVSSSTPKAVLVYFEDANSIETKETQTTSTGSKKVQYLYLLCSIIMDTVTVVTDYIVDYPGNCITPSYDIHSKQSN